MVMRSKIMQGVAPYVPAPIPREAASLPLVLGKELHDLSNRLIPIHESYTPREVGVMIKTTGSQDLSTSPTRITGYASDHASPAFDMLGHSADRVGGMFGLAGDGTGSVLVRITASFLVKLGAIAHDQSVTMYFGDGGGVWKQVARQYIDNAANSNAPILAVRVMEVADNAFIDVGLAVTVAGGVAIKVFGSLDIDVLGGA